MHPPAAGVAPANLPTVDDVLSRASSENFRVASRLLPAPIRRHLLAFYGFARLVDELGDAYAGDRLAALDWLTEETNQALIDPTRAGLHPLVARAAASLRAVHADPGPLFALIGANRQDQVVTSYDTFEALADYCRLSAEPVGQLVLAAFDAVNPQHVRWSNSICTGLQLAEHWQDVAEDAVASRVYLPADDMARFDVTVGQLVVGPPATRQLQALMAFEVARARRILDDGFPLIGSLRGRARWAVAGFWAGGHAALDAVAAQRFDPLAGAPRPAPGRVALHLFAALKRSRSVGAVA